MRRNRIPGLTATLLVLLFVVSAFAPTQSGSDSRSWWSALGFLTASPTPTETWTPAPTPTNTSTATPTATSTHTVTPTRTATAAPSATPTPTRLAERVLKVPVILQELPLSCEVAGMRMVLAALLGEPPSERELLDCMPQDPNPYLGFRGDPTGSNRFADGSINWANYGAYAPVVAETLNRCALNPAKSGYRAVALEDVSYQQVADAVLGGYPVIVWVTKQLVTQTESIGTLQKPVLLAFGEHVWVVVGYHEDGSFEVHDPYPQKSGIQTLRVQSFPNWALFKRMAVFVRPRRP